jgi:hypothetical protein
VECFFSHKWERLIIVPAAMRQKEAPTTQIQMSGPSSCLGRGTPPAGALFEPVRVFARMTTAPSIALAAVAALLVYGFGRVMGSPLKCAVGRADPTQPGFSSQAGESWRVSAGSACKYFGDQLSGQFDSMANGERSATSELDALYQGIMDFTK